MAEGDLYKSVMTYTFGGVIMQNVLYFTAKNSGLVADDLTFQLNSDWPSSWSYWTVEGAQMVSYYAQKMNTTAVESNLRPDTLGSVGLQEGEGAPLTSAVVVSLKTGFYGRSQRGRIYLGAYPVAWIESGKLSAAGYSNINARWGILHDKFGVGGSDPNWQFGVYSKKIGGYSIPYNTVGFLPYTTFLVRTDLGTERGRKS